MPRSFLIKKNYSHCPLKKRPVLKLDDDKDVSDNSEPENLSTKPEDLSMSASTQHQFPHKSITPPPGVALISALKREPLTHQPASNALTHPSAPHPGLASPPPPLQPPQHPAFFTKTSSGGPLEPLNLNTPAEPTHPSHAAHPTHPAHPHPHHPYASPQPAWPARSAAVAPHYPPPYFTFNYPYPPPAELYGAAHHAYNPAVLYPLSPARSPLQEQLSPYAPRDTSSVSPPHHYMTPPVDTPKLYMPWPQPDHCGLSPTSSVASSSSHTAFQSTSPPPATPEDLSSPGSVSSGSSSSAGSTSAGSKKRKDSSAPRYQCPDCSKSYSTYSGLSKHQQFHCAASAGSQAKKSFSCKYCEKVYVSLGALKMHIRTHTLPCKCRICGKAFSRPWLLQGHIRTHTGEKPFSCPHCNRAFADRSNLRAHLQTHSDVKKYSCSSCSKTFSRMSLLTKHTEGGCPGVQLGGGRVDGGVSPLGVALDHGISVLPPQEVKAYQ